MRRQMILLAGGSVTTHYRPSCTVAAAALRCRCQVAPHAHHGAIVEALALWHLCRRALPPPCQP